MKQSDNKLILEYLIDISGNENLKLKNYSDLVSLFTLRDLIKFDMRFIRYKIIQEYGNGLYSFIVKCRSVIIYQHTSNNQIIALSKILLWAINYILRVKPKEDLKKQKKINQFVNSL